MDDVWAQVLSDAAVSRQPAVPAPPPRDPRQYVGLLAPEAASALRQGRNAHIDLVNRFESGPAMYLWRTGPEGLPMAQGAEVARRFPKRDHERAAARHDRPGAAGPAPGPCAPLLHAGFKVARPAGSPGG